MPSLDWPGKQAVLRSSEQVLCPSLHVDAALSVGAADNWLIEGDNLLALKALLPHLAGRVQCVYLDPPYNTGQEHAAYSDSANSPALNAWLREILGPDAERLSRQDRWLCLMHPRLALLPEFLTADGVLFVSIDD